MSEPQNCVIMISPANVMSTANPSFKIKGFFKSSDHVLMTSLILGAECLIIFSPRGINAVQI